MSKDSNGRNQKKEKSGRSKGKGKTVFVTVGTTLFAPLITAVTTPEALEWMSSAGYTRLVIQYGRGDRPEVKIMNWPAAAPLKVDAYDFKATLADDIREADMVISHAGAGTVSEVLKMPSTRLVVVINTDLMNNHQTELAYAMADGNHLFVVESPQDLHFHDDDDGDKDAVSNSSTGQNLWNAMEAFSPVPMPPGDEHDFPRLLDSFLGFAPKKGS